ncbi:DUF916 domain-containing protein [Saccharomonospora sp. NPDC046836]|uniref:WxL protein peptidoglycan domain-containing protein n=1 Tax=Saccharomonospora sp. NPDC046836 TaxID=3156921 RepID=UPI0034062EED
MPTVRTRLRRAAAALACALVLLAGAAPGAALASPAAPPASSSDNRATFGVRPATATAPDTRPNFSYAATPGAVVNDFIAVSNLATTPVALRVYASDAFNTPDGGFDLLPKASDPVDVGAWVRTRASTVTVPARSIQIVPFSVRIPSNATPGDHAGGVVASLVTTATGAKGQKVAVEQRVGTRIYLRVSGAVRPGLSIEDVQHSYSGGFFARGDVAVSYTVRNTGNIRLAGRQQVSVSTPWGSTVEAGKLGDLPELLPGNSFRVTATVPELLPAGWLTGTVRIEPQNSAADPDLRLDPVTTEFTVVAVPWAVLAALALLIGLLVLRYYLRKRRRGASEDSDPVEKNKEERVDA